MIVELLFLIVQGLISMIGIFVEFPQLPEEFYYYVNFVFDYMEQAMGFVWLIVPRELVLILLPIVLIVANFETLYKMFMWVVRKIPMLGIQ